MQVIILKFDLQKIVVFIFSTEVTHELHGERYDIEVNPRGLNPPANEREDRPFPWLVGLFESNQKVFHDKVAHENWVCLCNQHLISLTFFPV
jgi:hypothetical protein